MLNPKNALDRGIRRNILPHLNFQKCSASISHTPALSSSSSKASSCVSVLTPNAFLGLNRLNLSDTEEKKKKIVEQSISKKVGRAISDYNMIEDEDKIPKEYTKPDLEKIGKDIRKSKGQIKIPGVKVHIEDAIYVE